MTIIQIRYFLETADCGSFQSASEKLYITHQALSKQIKAIEQELDVELFDRSNKKRLHLTETGSILYSVWKDNIARHDEAMARINQSKQAKDYSLVIGIQDVQKIRLASINAFTNYKLQNPHSEFKYKVGTPEEIRQMLDNGTIDIAILFSPAVECPEKYSSCIINKRKENPVIAISTNNPLSSKPDLTLKELEKETFIMIDSTYSKDVVKKQHNDFIANHINPDKLKIKTVPNTSELLMALVLNQGIALIHESLLEFVKDKIKTVPYKTAEENSYSGTILIWKNHNYDDVVNAIGALFEK